MKFLFWLDIGFDRHGPSVHLLEAMIEESLKANHDVAVIVRNTGGNEPDLPEKLRDYKNLQIEIIKDNEQQKNAFVKRYIEDIVYFFKSRKALQKHKNADIVFLQSCYLPILPIRMIKAIKKPVLFNVQNIFPIDAGVLGLLPTTGIKSIPYYVLRKLQQIAYKQANLVVTISEDMKETLKRESPQPNKIEVVYNWSYDDEPTVIPDSENLFLNDHPELKSKFKVVFAGNMGAMVNPKIIADAAENLRDYEDIIFIIIGAGNNMHYLKEMAKTKNLTNIVFFPYQPKEYARHNYAMANVNINALPKGIIYTCMPSKTATMLNSARPMVVAVESESDYARLLREVDRAVVVNWNDTEGFSKAILDIYNSKDSSDSQNSREIFKKYCSYDNAKSYVKYMETIVAKG